MDPGWFEFSSIFNLAFVEGMLLDMGAGLDTRKEHQATWELCEVSLYAMGFLQARILEWVASSISRVSS